MTEKYLVVKFREQFERVASLEQQVEIAKADLEKTKQDILDMFEANGSERTATYHGIGFISRSKPRLYANVNEENKPALFAHLRDDGRDDLIKEQVNPSTLSSYVSELIDNGKIVPSFVSYVLKPAVRLYDAKEKQ